MGKSHRGSGIRELESNGRANCPLCKRTKIKVMYEIEIDEKKLTICKQCKAAVGHGKMKEAIAQA